MNITTIQNNIDRIHGTVFPTDTNNIGLFFGGTNYLALSKEEALTVISELERCIHALNEDADGR
jgi:hypothetical protein